MIKLSELNRWRDHKAERSWAGEGGDDECGVFVIPVATATLRCIAATGEGWEHVSVSVNHPRCPTWGEMEYVKRLFFKPNEVAMQLHVATADHISNHPYVLHIWRPQDGGIPLPPAWMV